MTKTKRRVLLHVGLPKAASSSLQRWCAQHRTLLESKGFCYPATPSSLLVPKHQFLVADLLAGHCDHLESLFLAHHSQDFLFSDEGLTYLFDEFSAKGLALLRETLQYCDTQLFVITRDYASWSKSLYAQAILNYPGPERSYAGGMTIEEFRHTRHFKRLGDCANRLPEYEKAFGAQGYQICDLRDDWFKQFLQLVGLDDSKQKVLPPVRENESVSDELVEIVRQVNSMNLSDEVRSNFLAFICAFTSSLHNVLRTYRRMSDESRAKECFANVLATLRPSSTEQRTLIEEFANLAPPMLEACRPVANIGLDSSSVSLAHNTAGSSAQALL
jgi:hypothetical protein